MIYAILLSDPIEFSGSIGRCLRLCDRMEVSPHDEAGDLDEYYVSSKSRVEYPKEFSYYFGMEVVVLRERSG